MSQPIVRRPPLAGAFTGALVGLLAGTWLGCAAPEGAGAARDSAAGAAITADGAERRVTLRSEPFVVDRQMSSMEGPAQIYPVALDAGPDDIVWLRAVRNRALSEDREVSLSEEFLCHSNLALAGGPEVLDRANPLFRATPGTDPRLFTLIQGRNEVELPEGFAFPVSGGEALQFDSMVINENAEDLAIELVVETTIDYALDTELTMRPQPLFKRRVFTFLEVAGAAAAGEGHGEGGHGHHHGAARAEGEEARAEKASALSGRDAAGNEYTFHWLVEPGRHEYTSDITAQLALPFATTLHYATAHLHPYGESVRIVDRTTGETVLDLAARQLEGRVGIAEMEELSSSAGVPFDPAHRYDLVTVYDNTTGSAIDAMAIVYLFFHDRGFQLAAR
jgi:hypothetical protein